MTNQNDLMRKFEKWAKTEDLNLVLSDHDYFYGEYYDNDTRAAWAAWQAATQSALEAAAKVCAEKVEDARRASQNTRGDFGLAVSAQYAALYDCLQAIRALAGKGE